VQRIGDILLLAAMLRVVSPTLHFCDRSDGDAERSFSFLPAVVVTPAGCCGDGGQCEPIAADVFVPAPEPSRRHALASGWAANSCGNVQRNVVRGSRIYRSPPCSASP